jgi:putative resolvase
VTTVVAGHKDRLGRMNAGLAWAALAAHGRRLVVLDEARPETIWPPTWWRC